MISRTGFIIALIALVMAWYMRTTLLLVFAGALGALAISGVVESIRRRVSVPRVLCVWLIIVVALVVFVAGTAIAGSAVTAQVAQMQTMLRASLNSLAQQLHMLPLFSSFANAIDPSALLAYVPSVVARMGGFVGGAFGGIVAVFVVIFVTAAGALEPRLYHDGFVSLFAPRHRAAIEGLLTETGAVLRTWLFARALSMTLTGTLVWAGLALLHVPLAAVLGVLAGILAFIPNVGAFVAGAPAVLIAFGSSPRLALAVLLMYWIVHFIDDFAAAPFIERRIVRLPPILTLVAQLVLGFTAGTLGIMLAAPIVAASIVVTRRLWVEPLEGAASR